MTPEQLLTGKGIDEDYKEDRAEKAVKEVNLSKTDERMLEDFHGLRDAQKKRLLKYMKALKQIESLEDLYGREDGVNDHR